MKDKQGRRIDLLLGWRDAAAARGHEVPSAADVMRIAATGEIWPPDVDRAAAEPWRRTVDHLFTQLKFGVHDPLDQLPDELWVPDASAPRPSWLPSDTADPPTPAPTSQEDPVYTELQQWRAAEQVKDSNVVNLKDNVLRNIVRTHSVTEAQIRGLLPGTLKVYAAPLAEVMGRVPGPGHSALDPPTLYTEAPGRAAAPAAPETTTPPAPDAEAAPAPATAAPGSSADAAPAADEGLGELDLVDFAFTSAADGALPVDVQRSARGVRLRWPVAPGPGTVLYRVVSADDGYRPYSPQTAEPLTVTRQTQYVDARPFVAVVRYVQVWAHVGADVSDAADTEPVLHAETAVIAPVQDAAISPDEGKVVGHWTVLDGTQTVQIFRIPAEAASRGTGDPQYRILAHQPNLGGFVDHDVERGRTYLYQVFVEADVDGACRLSAPVSVRVHVPAILEPIMDLGVVLQDGDAPEFDLTWTPPDAGEVQVFRTERAPAAGASEKEMAVAALGGVGLPEEKRLRWPITSGAGGASAMERVPWPREWTRVYFTPVTVIDGTAAVGRTVSEVLPGQIRNARIVERTHKQVLTFAWPNGAASVLAWIGMLDQDADSAMDTQPQEITEAQYERQGGMHFLNRLPGRGCSVHLRPVAYNNARQITGRPVSLRYDGLERLRYSVAISRDKAGRALTVTVQIFSEFDNRNAPPFTLVHRSDRFPLEMFDGQAIPMDPVGDPRAQGGPRFVPSALPMQPGAWSWSADVRGLTGYVRLFVCLDLERSARVALMDPPIPTLRLDAVPAAQGNR